MFIHFDDDIVTNLLSMSILSIFEVVCVCVCVCVFVSSINEITRCQKLATEDETAIRYESMIDDR